MKEINLEQGKPYVDEALYLLERQISNCSEDIVVIIHGYGSSGKGGKIKEAVRSELKAYIKQDKIQDYLYGEEFNMFNEKARKIKAMDEDVKKYYGQNNYGITIIVL